MKTFKSKTRNKSGRLTDIVPVRGNFKYLTDAKQELTREQQQQILNNLGLYSENYKEKALNLNLQFDFVEGKFSEDTTEALLNLPEEEYTLIEDGIHTNLIYSVFKYTGDDEVYLDWYFPEDLQTIPNGLQYWILGMSLDSSGNVTILYTEYGQNMAFFQMSAFSSVVFTVDSYHSNVIKNISCETLTGIRDNGTILSLLIYSGLKVLSPIPPFSGTIYTNTNGHRWDYQNDVFTYTNTEGNSTYRYIGKVWEIYVDNDKLVTDWV